MSLLLLKTRIVSFNCICQLKICIYNISFKYEFGKSVSFLDVLVEFNNNQINTSLAYGHRLSAPFLCKGQPPHCSLKREPNQRTAVP